jgi:hypothetical protein
MNDQVPKGKVSYSVPAMPSARWVDAFFAGAWYRAWLQNETAMGYWVSIDPDSPYHLMGKVRELQ